MVKAQRQRSLVVAMLAGLVTSRLAAGAVWTTGDGLAVRLSDTTGVAEQVTVDGRPLPLATGSRCGLVVQEYRLDAATPERVLLHLDAEREDGSWTAAAFADWATAADTVRRREGGAAGGRAYMQIGDGHSPGVGLAAAARLVVKPGDRCRIAWSGRTRAAGPSYILCVRLFDAGGHDVSAVASAPQGWAYSPNSLAHYRTDVANTRPDVWEPFSYPYTVPDGVATMQVSLRVYRGGDLLADVDDLKVTARPSGWLPPTDCTGAVRATADGLEQRCELGDQQLAVLARYRGGAERLDAEVTVTSLGAPRDRCLRLSYRLPVDLAGWVWAGEPRQSESMSPGRRYANEVGWAGHPWSRYPLASVSHGAVGLAVATALDPPLVQSFAADTGGLSTVCDLALSATPVKAPARFTFSFYRHDAAWTFRAALERYYRLFPGLADGGGPYGAWTLRLPKPEVARPADFGLRFYECGALRPEVREVCRAQQLRTCFYIEPWGRRQFFAAAKTRAQLPPYEQRLAQLREWAQSRDATARWGAAPRREAAQAVLNSLLIGAEGQAEHLVDLYDTWAQWWQLSTDPDLPSPSIASLCWQYEIEPALTWADGIYLDSVSMVAAGYEDHDRAHRAALGLPLTFSLATGTPVALSGQAHYQFIARLRADLHRRQKTLMANLFAPATRLYGHLADVAGCELGGLQGDDEALQQRVYAYHRPVTNLLQWRWAILERVPAMTAEQVEGYLANQLLYAFHPGISTIGGGTEPGYRGLHRYFEDAALLARDRPLFARYLPVYDALAQAGWEPVTHARAKDSRLLVERFGRGPGSYLAVHNPTATPLPAALVLDDSWWRQALGGEAPPAFAVVLGEAAAAGGDPMIGAQRTLVLRAAATNR